MNSELINAIVRQALQKVTEPSIDDLLRKQQGNFVMFRTILKRVLKETNSYLCSTYRTEFGSRRLAKLNLGEFAEVKPQKPSLPDPHNTEQSVSDYAKELESVKGSIDEYRELKAQWVERFLPVLIDHNDKLFAIFVQELLEVPDDVQAHTELEELGKKLSTDADDTLTALLKINRRLGFIKKYLPSQE